MKNKFLLNDFRKVTGPIEHWLTTFHTGYWGFRPDKKEAWENIEVGEVFLFHASASEFLEVPRKEVRDVGRGVIGVGRVGAKSTKDEPAWWEEIHSDGDYPYLIHFSELHWFGDTEVIRDVPVREKSVEEMVEDVHALDENKISFGEMDERAEYRIPAQGSPGNVKYPEKLFPLLVERIHGVEPDVVGYSETGEGGTDSTRRPSAVRQRSRDRNLDATAHGGDEIRYEPSIGQTMEGWIAHEHALDTFENALLEAGYESGETKHSDILAHRSSSIVLGEAQSIHSGNERAQIRTALGQLDEYTYFDVKQDTERAEKDLTKCLILTQEPSTEYRNFLVDLQHDGVYTFWIEDSEIQGLCESMTRFGELTS